MDRQIDSRVIDPGSATSVALYINEKGYVVRIERGVDEVRVLTLAYIGSDGAAALDAYRHPFVSPDVPDIWARRSEDVVEIERVPETVTA